ncbi:MAG: GAF domain-containing protein [SAR202 cluster bacterium]|jgi:PAS domain S-box-containing protein|nr:GAF domain-containing protein [SAR202 cluster bacterium]MDP6713878.1 GAF domain-containing protein [SAR202 cluster bacterium]
MRFLQSLHAKVLFSAFIPGTLVLVVVAVIALFAYERTARVLVEQRDAELARMSAARLKNGLDQHASVLVELTENAFVQALDIDGVRLALDRAESQIQDFDGGVAIYNAEGIAVWSSVLSDERRAQGFPLPSEIEKVRSSEQTAYSNIFLDAATGKEAILITVPIITRSQAFAGVAAGFASIDDSILSAMYSEVLDVRPSPDGFAYLVDGNGKAIFHRQLGFIGDDFSAFSPVVSVAKGDDGALISEDRAGQTVLSGFAPVPGSDWGVITQERWANVVGPIRTSSFQVIGLLVIGALTASVGIWIFIGRALRPIRDLNQGAQRIASGDFDYTIDADTGDEVQELAQQFNTMASALRASYAELEDRVALRTRELRESEERMRAVMTGAPVMILALDREGNFTLSEGQGLQAFGMESGAWDGESILSEHQGRSPDVSNEFHRALAGEEVISTIRWEGITYDTRFSPLRDDEGDIQGVIVIGTDITERVRAEEAERLRAQELEALFNVASLITQPGTLDQKTSRVLQELAQVIEGDLVTLRVPDEAQEGLRLVSYVESGLGGPPPVDLWPFDDSLVGEAYSSGRPVVVNDYMEHEAAESERIARGVMSAVAVPIEVDGRALGTITAGSQSVNHFTPQSVRLLNAIADGTGSLLESARLLEGMRESEERYRTLFEQSTDAILNIHENKIIDINQSALDLFTFPGRDFAVESGVLSIFSKPVDLTRVRDNLDQYNSVKDFEIRFRKSDGEEFDGLLTASRTWSEDGRHIGTQAIIRDITEQKAQERALIESEEAARALANENSVMAEIGRIVGSSLDISQVYDRFAEQAEILLPFDAVTVILVDQDKQTFNISYMSGLIVPERMPGTAYPLEGTATVEAYNSLVPILFQPHSREEVEGRFPGLLPAYNGGIRSFLLAPMISNNQAIGVLYFNSVATERYTEEHVKITQRVASQIAGAVANSQLYEARTRAEEQLRASLEENQQLFQQEQHRAEQLAVINEVGRRVTSTLDVRQVLSGVGRLIGDSLGYQISGVGMIEGDELVFGRDINPTLREPVRLSITPAEAEKSVTGWVAYAGEALLIPDVSTDTRYAAVSQFSDTRSEMAAPIMASGQPVGVLDVQNIRVNAFDETDLSVLQSLAQQLGIAVENAQLFQAEQRRAEQFRIIGELSSQISSYLEMSEVLSQTVELIQRTFNYHHVGIGLVEADEVVYKFGAGNQPDDPDFSFEPSSLELGQEGTSGQVAATGEAVLVSNVDINPSHTVVSHSDTRSELTLPIRARGQVIGILDLQSDQVNAFDESDVVMLQSLANEAGIAIENARVFEAERRRNDQIQAINTMATNISSVLTLDELLPYATRLVFDTFDYDVVSMFLVDEVAEEAVIQASEGAPTEDGNPAEMGFKISFGQGIIGNVARTGETQLVNNTSEDQNYYFEDHWASIKSELSVPIKQADSVVGILDLQSNRLGAFDGADVATIETLANQLAVAMENARLFDESRDLAVLEERNRMAREIHDTLAQGFTGIVLQMEASEDVLQEDPTEVQQHLTIAKNLAPSRTGRGPTLGVEPPAPGPGRKPPARSAVRRGGAVQRRRSPTGHLQHIGRQTTGARCHTGGPAQDMPGVADQHQEVRRSDRSQRPADLRWRQR